MNIIAWAWCPGLIEHVAFDARREVGHIVWGHYDDEGDSRHGFIYATVAYDEGRGGVGTALVYDALALMRSWDVDSVDLVASGGVEGFWERFGFERFGFVRSDDGPIDGMRLDLRAKVAAR